MSRDWKPGDVARVRYENVDQIALVRPRKAACGALEFAYSSGGYDMVAETEGDARPLAVIDLEDHDVLDPIIDLIWGDRDPSNRPATWQVREKLKALLFAPPKPEEPTGLGAVVEDADGIPWVRTPNGAWYGPGQNFVGGYFLLDAVRVLHEGVQP